MGKAIVKIEEPKLTLKERKFLDEYFSNGGNATRAVQKVYNYKSYGTAGVMGSQLLKKLKVTLSSFMEAKGFNLEMLLVRLSEGMKATKIITSHTEPDRKVTDYAERRKYLQIASKWLGAETTQQEEGQLKRRVVAEEYFNE